MMGLRNPSLVSLEPVEEFCDEENVYRKEERAFPHMDAARDAGYDEKKRCCGHYGNADCIGLFIDGQRVEKAGKPDDDQRIEYVGAEDVAESDFRFVLQGCFQGNDEFRERCAYRDRGNGNDAGRYV